MKEYRYKNATVYVYGEINKERLKKATIEFVKKSYAYKKSKEKDNGNDNTT